MREAFPNLILYERIVMLLEILVVGVCVNPGQNGCQEATHSYYTQSKELQQISKNLEKIGNNIVEGNEWIIWGASPIYMIAAGQTAQIKLHDNWYMDINASQRYAGIRWNF
jgi:hypothetical protein